MKIDSSKCTGCGVCVTACPEHAIAIHDDLAVINANWCIQCGTCAEVCPAGAIREEVPVRAELAKGGDSMSYGYGRGFGFRGASPPWPYVGRGRGGMPRCWYPGLWGEAAPYAAPGVAPYWSAPTRDEELGFLKDQDEVMKGNLEDIERRIQELEKKS